MRLSFGPSAETVVPSAVAGPAHRAVLCWRAGDHAGTERECTRALDGDPGLAAAWYLRARVRERAGRYAEATRDLERALALSPGHLEAILLLAVCLSQTDLGDQAAACLDRALTVGRELAPWMPPRPRFAGRPQHGPDPEASPSPDSAVAGQRSFADHRCRLAERRIEAGEPLRALHEIEAALTINPSYLAARLLAVQAYLVLGDAGRAAAQAEAMTEARPDYPDLHYWLGLARSRADDFTRAAPALERAVDLNRRFARAHRLLGLVHHAQGRTGEALRSLMRGLVPNREPPPEIAPAPPRAAERDACPGESEASDYPDLCLARARELRCRGDLAGAEAACRAALELVPGYDAATLELARVTLVRGRRAAAERLLTALAERRPGWADVLGLLGRTRLEQGRTAAAESVLRAALRLNPRFAVARADLGWALRAQGRPRDADAEFAWALELDPNRALPRQRLTPRAG